ncbi:outer membrane protein assembly factor [Elizabethkingia sp. JS20170427COW]|uniref:BamA/OMP85 family outer membrane protein n=1 Tax=Elizabethkingia sp. JS20170427COW TaxID=2583851 RepID=UPI001110C5CA|nr:POTRA domain-containing protein [Elizabethkingia sp. JS20170427COW]QCX53306.1 outer membrane protein assembly factor BamA [Elizabethkingia sp. JS20170427COW]
MKFRSIPIFLFIASAHFYGQVTPPTQQNNSTELKALQDAKYTLKDIVVDGDKKYTPEQILRFTGLMKGETVEIPGQRLSTAIKKLWDTESFSEVEVYVEDVQGQNIILKFSLQGLKELAEVKFVGKGIKKSKNEKFIKDNNLKPGMKITQNLVSNLQHNIPQQYIKKGFPDAHISIEEKVNAKDPALVDWTINVDKGKRVKIDKIEFTGNKSVSSAKLRKKGFKDTKQKRFILGLIKPSKFIQEKYEEDKKNLVDYYNSLGFRDMRVVSDSVTRNDKGYNIKVNVDEGKKYYIGDITFVGNTVFSSQALSRILGYKKGDIYDSVGFKKKVGEDGGKEDNSDIASSYMDNGYLFSNVTAVEKSIKNDTINMEIRINEGSKATWNRVTWGGNTTTHDHVILRSLRTKPGNLFSKADIKRTYFDLAGMQYFDPQQIGQDIKPNPVDNTADIHWTVVEKGSSQVQVQAGYGGRSFIGTIGLTFNNFSLRNFLKFKDFKPVPQGDGQILSLQAQAGQYFQSYSLSFTEPWLFGTRPTALSTSVNLSKVKYTDVYGNYQRLEIFSANVGLNKLLRWPDNYFSLYTGLSYQRYKFDNYPFQFGAETLYNGEANNFSVNIGLSRNAAGPDPFFKTSGTDFEISAKFTPPYSLLKKKDYSQMSALEKYKWLEYYKVKLKADAYNEIIGKLVLRSSIEMGFLDGYNRELGAPPFERFYMGGTGLMYGRYDGRELIPLRGYEDSSSSGGTSTDVTPYGGGTIYNRINFELRYPISMSQTAKIYALTFAEGGNTWKGWGSYNPFQLKRSVGVGVRVYMGAFGLIGFDFAYGFDKTITGAEPEGWKTHFLMNQQL